jgi:hypothetical protein
MNALDDHGDGDPSSPPRAPLAPVVERSSLVLWLGDGRGAMLDGLDRSVVGALAASLSQAARNVSALRRARRELGLGQIFDLECWRLQLDVGHPLRGAAWEALGMDSGRVYRPDTHTVSGKTAVVVCLLRGESLDLLARETGQPAGRIAGWREEFLAGGREGLKSAGRDRGRRAA